jgi:hypothetical protein
MSKGAEALPSPAGRPPVWGISAETVDGKRRTKLATLQSLAVLSVLRGRGAPDVNVSQYLRAAFEQRRLTSAILSRRWESSLSSGMSTMPPKVMKMRQIIEREEETSEGTHTYCIGRGSIRTSRAKVTA